MAENTRKCSGILARSYRWCKRGSGIFLTIPETTSNRCTQCAAFEECMKSSLKQAYPTADYKNNDSIYINLRPKAEVLANSEKGKAEEEQTEEMQAD